MAEDGGFGIKSGAIERQTYLCHNTTQITHRIMLMPLLPKHCCNIIFCEIAVYRIRMHFLYIDNKKLVLAVKF